MSNRIPNELSVGDIIHHRKGTTLYKVIRFSRDVKPHLVVIRSSGGRELVRSMDQILKNWRL